ncbi:putative DD41D transposase [Trichonephila clavipes]|nr:putative DD41D transposase [Trichonephila clavipes]
MIKECFQSFKSSSNRYHSIALQEESSVVSSIRKRDKISKPSILWHQTKADNRWKPYWSDKSYPDDISYFTTIIQELGVIRLKWLCHVSYHRNMYHCSCQVIYSQFGLAIHQNDHQARRRFVEWAQNEIAFVPDFHKRILFSDEAHFWMNGYVNKQNCRIWSETNPRVYVETPLHPEKLTVWCALWAGGILLQKR